MSNFQNIQNFNILELSPNITLFENLKDLSSSKLKHKLNWSKKKQNLSNFSKLRILYFPKIHEAKYFRKFKSIEKDRKFVKFNSLDVRKIENFLEVKVIENWWS
jgi:hypothetical protein